MQVSQSEPLAPRARLLPRVGVGFGVAVTVGTVVSAGLLRVPGLVAAHVQSFWPFIAVWLAGGVYAVLGANAIAELATLEGRSGGPYVFVRRGLGRLPGFIAGWSDWLAMCGVTAAVALVIGDYAVAIYPAARSPHVIALAVVALFTLLQWIGMRPAAAVQGATTIVKVLALLLFVVVCFWLGTRMPAASAPIIADHEGSYLLALVLAMHAVVFAYDGWAAAAYFTEEMRDQPRSVPRALIASAITVAGIYLVAMLAFLAVVPVATFAGSGLAAGVVAERLFGAGGDVMIRFGGILILLSAVSASVLMAPRVLFAMAADGMFWRGAREVNRRGTPDIALLVSSMAAAAFIISGSFEHVVTTLALFYVANYAMSFLALFVLRRREPEATRTWRAWGHPWTTALPLLGSVTFLIISVVADPKRALYAIIALLLAGGVWGVLERRRQA